MKKILIPFFLLCLTQSVLAKEAFVYDAKDKRDPFWPLVNASGAIINYDKNLQITDMALEGIMIESSGQDIAIINGMIVQENETVGDYLVREITTDTVLLQKGQETFSLKLKKED